MKINDIKVHIRYKRVRNINLRVCPPDGAVRVSAPRYMSRKEVRAFLISKSEWIKRKQKEIAARERDLQSDYNEGSLHTLLGKKYPLRISVTPGPSRAEIRNEELHLAMNRRARPESRSKIIKEFYRDILKERVPALIARYEPIMGVRVEDFGIKEMRSRWGSCNTATGKIWLSLELARREPDCLEAIVVHEMVHLLERKHNKHFYALMGRFYPEWKEAKEKLNSSTDPESDEDC